MVPPGGGRTTEDDWPIFGLRLQVDDLVLRHVRESDLCVLADLQPDDHEHDPRAFALPGEDTAALRRRLVHQGYWRSVGTWTPESWCLDLLVERAGAVLGVQSLEAEDFPTLRTVDSGSWLIPAARGRGVGVAMRRAVLGLAFDHLGARAAVTSASTDNLASLGVSRRLGYLDNGVGLARGHDGPVELRHLRLTRDRWDPSADPTTITGLDPCRPWFGLPT